LFSTHEIIDIQLEYYSNCSTTEHLDSNGAKLC